MHCGNLVSILGKAFPAVTSHDVLTDVVQANAEGHLVKLHSDDVATNGKEVFVKQVVASNYAHKSWPDFRRSLMYIRTEIRFYNEMVPVLAAKGFNSTPPVYLSDYNLDGLVEDSVKSTDPCSEDPVWEDEGQGGFIVMESVGDDYFQDSPLTIDQAKQCLTAFARLHATSWEDQNLLKLAEDRLSRGSYHLETRNPKELAGMEDAWTSFKSNFQDKNPELFDSCGNLGKRIFDLAGHICKETSPSATAPYACLIHGDSKAMNAFIPKNKDDEAILLDFASAGVGIGMSDVAMHIHHAVRPADLANGGEQELIDHYIDTLNSYLHGKEYPRDIAMVHYQLAMADYFRFFLGRFWKTATPESFEKKKGSKNTSFINRDVASALAFLERVNKCILNIEKDGSCDPSVK